MDTNTHHKIMRSRVNDDDVRYSQIWSKRSKVIDRLLAQGCELCGTTDKIEVHYIRNFQTSSRRENQTIQNE